ncbi:hypothetical protein CCH79_00011843 [Gambusia affinis]|uniref:Uncharacterized protein n=1 Tax=Gambusia affinis TaxID=33528 RepID=A0A315VQC5_GAMAF|nr:hypothetical protein CCH79_00011843 [Gambusia affinis]
MTLNPRGVEKKVSWTQKRTKEQKEKKKVSFHPLHLSEWVRTAALEDWSLTPVPYSNVSLLGFLTIRPDRDLKRNCKSKGAAAENVKLDCLTHCTVSDNPNLLQNLLPPLTCKGAALRTTEGNDLKN